HALPVVKAGCTHDQDIPDLILAGTGDYFEGAAGRIRRVLAVADRDDIGGQLGEGGLTGERIRVGDNAGLFSFEAEARPAMPGQLQTVVSEIPTSLSGLRRDEW